MLPASRQLLPVIGIDVHMIIILGVPTPIPHPFIGLVFDPMDFAPKIGASVNVNGIPRANSGTNGMLATKAHIPLGGPFAMAPTIAHESQNFFGSKRVNAEGSYFSGAGFMVMSCSDIGMPLSFSKSLYLPTSASIPVPGGKPVIVGGPYVPDLMGLLMSMVMSLGLGALLKAGGKLLKKALKALNNKVLKKFKCTQGLSKKFCKHGFEPVNLVTGSVLYDGVDFEIPGIIPIRWERNWYSDSDYEGLLGHGTHLCYDLTLQVFEEDGAIGIILPDGRSVGFPLVIADKEKFYHQPEKLTLTCKGRTCYELFDHNTRLIYSFERLQDNIFKPISLSNESGVAIRLYYNSNHILQKIVDTAGRQIIISIDGFNRIVMVEAEHRGSKRIYVKYEYNESGDLVAITDAYDKTTSIRYVNHLMVEKTDRNGATFYWEYDGVSTGSRCVHTYGENGLLEGWIEYREGYNVVTNSLGETKLYYYDENGLCIQETDALGNSVFYQFTDDIELYRFIDEEGNLTGYLYDERGNMTAYQRPDGTVNRFLYDESDRLTMSMDAEDHSSVYIYQDNHLKRVVKADQSVLTYEHNSRGLVSKIRNNDDQLTFFEYDEDDNLSSMVLPDAAEANWVYDEWGRCIKNINPEKQSQRFEYDLLNRVINVKKYDGNNVRLRYNAYDDIVLAKDHHRNVRYEYTALGKLKSREQNGSKRQYNYDTEERLVSFSNEHHELYRFYYDKRGQIVQETGFDGEVTHFVRSKSGKVVKRIRPGGKYTEYEHDNAGRITRIEYFDGSWEIYSYDKRGYLSEAINENSSVIITWDAAGRLIRENQNGHILESNYDRLGRATELKTSFGHTLRMERNHAGLVSKLNAANQDAIDWQAEFAYNAIGQQTERILPGGIRSVFEYNISGKPMAQTVKRDGETVRVRKYNWDVNDRLRSMANGIGNGKVEYGYDDFGNLAWAKYEDGEYDYRMPDNAGNVYRSPDRRDRKYVSGGQLEQADDWKYEYDDEGNLTSKSSIRKGQWRYQWFGNGMLKKVTRPDGKEVIFEYDALGRRTAKLFDEHITRWIWNGNTPIHEWKYELKRRPLLTIAENGQLAASEPEPNDNIITWVFDEGSFRPAARLQGNNHLSIITDYLGTPVEMYDGDGTLKWGVEYDIYRKIRKQVSGNPGDCPFRYQGQYEDIETGLCYNRFRYYDNESGNYISQDPIGLAGHNPTLYGYVQDPNIWIDPSGLDCATAKKLQAHADAAKAEAKLSQKQQDSIDRSKARAAAAIDPKDKAYHEMMAAKKEKMYMGTQVDTKFKAKVEADPDLSHLETTPRGEFGPDAYDPKSKEYYDCTTQKDWDKGTHQEKYDDDFGKGTGIFW